MPRNVIVIAKVVPAIDAGVDAVINGLKQVRDLFGLIEETQSGRALLYWSAWYDPWLLGNDLNPEDWRWKLSATPVADSIWKLSLTDGDWPTVQRDVSRKTQYSEQHWLAWHLWHAYDFFNASNDKARLYFGREVLGGSLSDEATTKADGKDFRRRLRTD